MSVEALRAQRDALTATLPRLDQAISELQDLAGEVDERRRAADADVARARIAAGGGLSFGPPAARTVTVTDGRGTVQLAGPAPADSAASKADHARLVLAAIEAEGRAIRAALIDLQRQRTDTKRTIGLLGLEIDGLERQQEQDAERARLLGPNDWRERLAAILRRLGGG